MIGGLSVVLLARLFLTAECLTGQVPPPQNLSLLWISDFEPQLTWTPQRHPGVSCSYTVLAQTNQEEADSLDSQTSPPWTSFIVMEGGSLRLSAQTVCGGRESKPTVLNVSYPDMVRNVKCCIHSSKKTSITWEPAVPSVPVDFFYGLTNEDLTASIDNGDFALPLRECSSYTLTGGARSGCELQAALTQSIYILFNGTENERLFRNTFRRGHLSQCSVKLPPLTWTGNKTGNKVVISWIPPDIRSYFRKFAFNLTVCNATMYSHISDISETSTELSVEPHCQYCIAMQAVYQDFSTPWAQQCFDADAKPNTWVYAVVLVPLLVAGVAALTLVCCWKNKHRICPKVPQPRDLLKDILDNGKGAFYNQHIPAEEPENCKITLAMEPRIHKHAKLCGGERDDETHDSLLSAR